VSLGRGDPLDLDAWQLGDDLFTDWGSVWPLSLRSRLA
jgi:hypothetical protein